MIDADAELELVGVASNLPELLNLVVEQEPDVVVTDIRMPPTGTDEGIQAAEVFRRTHPRLAVLVLSQFADPGYVLALLRAGTRRRGYLLKQHLADPGQLRTAAHTVAGGGSFIDPEVVRVWAAAQARSSASPVIPARAGGSPRCWPT
jgi:DNA-binding NarL/FixJ family response regulator